MFITENDYAVVIGKDSLKVISGASAESRYKAEQEAIEEISGYLRPRFDCDSIFGAEEWKRNQIIVMIAVDIAIYHLTASAPQRMGAEIRKERYDRAIKWLEGVQAGKIVPDLPLAGSDDDNSGFGISYHSFPKLRHDW